MLTKGRQKTLQKNVESSDSVVNFSLLRTAIFDDRGEKDKKISFVISHWSYLIYLIRLVAQLNGMAEEIFLCKLISSFFFRNYRISYDKIKNF